MKPLSLQELYRQKEVYSEQKSWHRLIVVLEQIILLEPEAQNYTHYGLALIELGHLDRAENSFQQALKMKPGLIEAVNGLEKLKVKKDVSKKYPTETSTSSILESEGLSDLIRENRDDFDNLVDQSRIKTITPAHLHSVSTENDKTNNKQMLLFITIFIAIVVISFTLYSWHNRLMQLNSMKIKFSELENKEIDKWQVFLEEYRNDIAFTEEDNQMRIQVQKTINQIVKMKIEFAQLQPGINLERLL